MSWKLARAVKEKKTEAGEITAQLKQELTGLLARNDRVKEELKRINELWLTIGSPRDSARLEFVELRSEIYQSSDEMMQGIMRYNTELRDIAQSIAQTPNSHYSELLALFSQMIDICKTRLESEVPRRREVTAWREQGIEKLRHIVEVECHKQSQ
jgi:hypothetical protein